MKPPPSLVVSSPFEFAESTAIPSTPTGNHSLRSQLHHILPRHTYFHVRLVVHQLTNVPLVSGEFCVRWKFKNVHAPTRGSSKLLNIVKGRSSSRTPLNGRKGKGKDTEDDADYNSQGSTEQLPDSRPITPDWNHTHSHLSSGSNMTMSSIPHTSSSSSTHTTISSSSSAPSLTFTPPPPPSTTSSPPDFSPAHTPTPGRARGQTPFVRLKDHTASWGHTVDVVVRMDIERSDAALLLPSPLKLVVTQPREKEDLPHPHKPSNPRLGAVYLDLAQYAEKGEVVRRYLLRESKTNALLKLSIQLTHISGPTNFHAPLLPKGEILNGISGIILENDVYRARPKGLDIYGPYYDLEELEYDLFGHGEDESDTDGATEDGNGNENENQDEGDNTGTVRSGDSRHKAASVKSEQSPKAKAKTTINGRSFDPERLPLAYGPKTTETLIEAIFNPVKTTEKRRESPFTILVSPDETEEGGSSDSASQQRVLWSPAMGIGMSAAGAGATVGRGTGPGKRPLPSPLRSTHPSGSGSGSGSGIGAGLGIMGLGMGIGIGLGVGFGVEGATAARSGSTLTANGGGGSSINRSETNGNGNPNGGRWKTSVTGRGLKGKGKAVAQDTLSVRTTSSGDIENDRDKDRDREYDHASLTTRSMSTSTSRSTWSMHSGEGEGEEAWSESSHSHSQSRSHSGEGEYEGGGHGRTGEGGRAGGVKGWWRKHALQVGMGTSVNAAMSNPSGAQTLRV